MTLTDRSRGQTGDRQTGAGDRQTGGRQTGAGDRQTGDRQTGAGDRQTGGHTDRLELETDRLGDTQTDWSWREELFRHCFVVSPTLT